MFPPILVDLAVASCLYIVQNRFLSIYSRDQYLYNLSYVSVDLSAASSQYNI